MQSSRGLKKLKKLLENVKSFGEEIGRLSDEELAGRTAIFKERYAGGESLDSLLPEAFAVAVEADERLLGKRPYDVQIMAGIALHQGFLAEMNTGEGKTLAATMPLYLNALTGRPCILVTTNEYLAHRDGEELSPVYNFLGLTCAYPDGVSNDRPDDDVRKKMYSADILYTTNASVGFDYLINNLIKKREDRFIHDMYYVIIDEADSVLLESANMPLVISGVPRVQSNHYEISDFFVRSLQEDIDYIEEEGAVWLTEEGVKYAERFFGIDNYFDPKYFDINRHVTLALRAHKLLELQKDYLIVDGKEKEIKLFDSSTGRILNGVKMRGGMHQAIEAKEHVKITQETRTIASVTYQNLFQMFEKFAGMSGTIMNDKDEFFDVYHKRVVAIPPNRPVIRKDYKDLYFKNATDQFHSALLKLLEIHRTGQPVLVILNNVIDTETFSKLLMEENIPHNVLNANNAFWEADIIKDAGQKDAVTVATPMAGRGTDIKLGEGVRELGGLAVIGIGRMSDVRSERQARGRSGRQGDPGFSIFYTSLEDDIVGAEDNEKLQKIIEGKKRITKHKLKRVINKSQSLAEEGAQNSRKQSVQYDTVLQRQRSFIYKTRNNLLDGERIEDSQIVDIAMESIDEFLSYYKYMDKPDLSRYILDNLSYTIDDRFEKIDLHNMPEVRLYLKGLVEKGLRRQRNRIGDTDNYEQFIREATLAAVDDGWVELIDYLDQLKAAVSGRASAQRNVIFEYQNEAYDSYRDTEAIVKRNIVRNVLLCDASIDKKGKLSIVFP